MGNALAHFGVKGMKWGVRKSRSRPVRDSLSRARTAAKKAIQDVDKAQLLRNVISAGLGSAATMGATAVLGNPIVAGIGVSAVQTVIMNYGEVGAIEASEWAVKSLTRTVLSHDDFNDDSSYLAHHGVKGMKWGVRRDPARSASKRTDRMIKRDAKAAKLRAKVAQMEERHAASVRSANAQLKRAKYVRQLGRYEIKAGKHAFTDIGVWRRENAARKANRMRGKIHTIDAGSQSYQARKLKMTARANRLELRNKRAAKRLAKQLPSLKRSDLTPEQRAIGKKYIDRITS